MEFVGVTDIWRENDLIVKENCFEAEHANVLHGGLLVCRSIDFYGIFNTEVAMLQGGCYRNCISWCTRLVLG